MLWKTLTSILLLNISIHAQEGTLSLLVTEKEKSEALPCRVHLKNASGKFVEAPGLPYWKNHFSCNGKVELKLPAGTYTYSIERGPEYTAAKGTVEIKDATPAQLKLEIERITDMAADGWWSGEMHVHRPMEEAELLMQAEDLHIAHFITWWNAANPWAKASTPPDGVPVKFGANYFYDRFGGEDEREGGALLFLNLHRTINVQDALDHYPPSNNYAKQARKLKKDVWIDAEKPYWWDFPLWIAESSVDTVGIANNHMQQFGMLDNESRGKPRDLERYPDKHGNGLWTQDIYYHLLNCGIHMPPSAGSASGVLWNPVGYNRIYANLDGEFTYEKWHEAVLAGRTFVTNGPLLICKADDKFPGHVFRADPKKTIPLNIRLHSSDRIRVIEVIQNGEIIHSVPCEGTLQSLPNIALKPGWFLVRCIADVPETFRFASTAPYYVEAADGKPVISRTSAQFFLDWCKEREARYKAIPEATDAQKNETLELWKKADAFWADKVLQANAK